MAVCESLRRVVAVTANSNLELTRARGAVAPSYK